MTPSISASLSMSRASVFELAHMAMPHNDQKMRWLPPAKLRDLILHALWYIIFEPRSCLDMAKQNWLDSDLRLCSHRFRSRPSRSFSHVGFTFLARSHFTRVDDFERQEQHRTTRVQAPASSLFLSSLPEVTLSSAVFTAAYGYASGCQIPLRDPRGLGDPVSQSRSPGRSEIFHYTVQQQSSKIAAAS